MDGPFVIRKVLTSVVLISLSVCIGLVLMEFAVRAVMPQFDPSGQVAFRSLPGGTPLGPANKTLRQIKNTGDFDVQVVFNNYGFRDDKDLAQTDGNSIFVVGDSFSFGWGVTPEERYSGVLQKLQNRPVFNISIPTDLIGYKKLVAYAERSGARIGTLIIGVCMENDIRDYGAAKSTATPSQSSAAQSLKHWLHDHSALYFFLTSIIHTSPILRDLFVKLGLIVPNLDGIEMPELAPNARSASVAELEALAEGRKAVVLIIPSRWLWVGDASRRQAVSEFHDAFVADLRARGLTVVDPRVFMERNGPPLKFHFQNDGHWRPGMHAIAAEMLLAELRR